MTSSKFAILYVDDEPKALKYFEEMFEDIAPIYTVSTPEEALKLFEQRSDEFGLVLSDHQMPGMTGVEFLNKVRAIDSGPLRMLVTAFADLSEAVDLLNDNLLYSYLSKPWDPEELTGRLVNALDFYGLSQHRDRLLREKSLAFQQLSIADRANTMSMVSCGLNHHMRNSLNVVSSFFELAPEQLELEFGRSPRGTQFWDEFHEVIGVEIDRMIGLLTHFTEVSTNHQIKVEEGIDLQEIFTKARDLTVHDEEKIQINIEQHPDTPTISGDAGKLGQMARQLLKESIRNIGETGIINITVSSDPERGVLVSCSDDGSPIAEGDLEHLFDPFFVRSGDPNELGIDLVGSFLTVYHHGGTMNARRCVNGKNVIEFSLPLVPNPPEENIALSRQLLNHDTAKSTELVS